MYWGAAEEARSDASDPRRRTRRLVAVVALTVVSIAGSVAMASASPSHAGASPNAVATAAFDPVPAHMPRDLATTSSTVPVTTPPTTAAPPTTSTTRPAVTAPPATTPAPRPSAPAAPTSHQQAAASALQTRSTPPPAPAVSSADTCGAALAYLAAHAAPGFQFQCPGYALGHQAMTCVDVAGVCPGFKLIVISDVCPASYMNEAHNSWILSGLATGQIDPYGYCH